VLDKVVQLSRNPYARYTIVRNKVEARKCDFCGQPAKFQYGVDLDAGGTNWQRGVFCGKSCCESYHSITLS
jgi:hypothetical protein